MKYVATGSMSRPGGMSRQEVCRDQAVCRDQCRDKQYVATSVATSSMSRPESFVATRNAEKPKKKKTEI